jgi:hypothetical protein
LLKNKLISLKDLTEFSEKLEELDIRLNSEVIHRLYEALTIESTSQLSFLKN